MSGSRAKEERRRCKRKGCTHKATHTPVLLLRRTIADEAWSWVPANLQVCEGDRGAFSLNELLRAVGHRIAIDYQLATGRPANMALTRLEFWKLDRFGHVIHPVKPSAAAFEMKNSIPTVEIQPADRQEAPAAPAGETSERPN